MPLGPGDVEDEEYFLQIPWCVPYLDRTRYTPIPGIRRKPQEGPRQNTLFTRTLPSSDSLRATISLAVVPPEPNNNDGGVTETVTLLSLGSDMNGWSDTIHGGFTGVLLDECSGLLLGLNDAPSSSSSSSTKQARTYTAYLNISYRKPLRTPQVVIGKSRIRSRQGRKMVIEVQILDREGVVLCEAETMFITDFDKAHKPANL